MYIKFRFPYFNIQFISIYVYCIYGKGTNEKQFFRLFAVNRKQKRQTSVCLLKIVIENGSLLVCFSFFLVGKKRVINDCCFSKWAHLWR